jgi:hypothetical protein
MKFVAIALETRFSSVKVFEDCSGGNSRLSYLLGCGGRSFFDQQGCSLFWGGAKGTAASQPKPRRGIEPGAGSLILSAHSALVDGALVGAQAGALVASTTLGIFFRFQVTDGNFGFFSFSLCHFIFPILFIWGVVCGLFCVSDTEEHLLPALNVLFWNQVVEVNQFIFCALAPFTY